MFLLRYKKEYRYLKRFTQLDMNECGITSFLFLEANDSEDDDVDYYKQEVGVRPDSGRSLPGTF